MTVRAVPRTGVRQQRRAIDQAGGFVSHVRFDPEVTDANLKRGIATLPAAISAE